VAPNGVSARRILAQTPTPASGLYEVRDSGEGMRLPRNDGYGDIIIGKRLTAQFGRGTLDSSANDNTRFVLRLTGAGPIVGAPPPRIAIVIDDIAVVISSQSDPKPDGTIDVGGVLEGAQAAVQIEKALNISATRRSDPGHRLQLACKPHKEFYKLGEPIELRIRIRNADILSLERLMKLGTPLTIR